MFTTLAIYFELLAPYLNIVCFQHQAILKHNHTITSLYLISLLCSNNTIALVHIFLCLPYWKYHLKEVETAYNSKQ